MVKAMRPVALAVAVALVVSVAFVPLTGAQGKETLIVWTPHIPQQKERRAGFELIAREFERLNPDIAIKHEAFAFDEHNTSVKLAVQGGTGPDVLNSQVGADAQDRYFRTGLLLNLTPLAAKSEWLGRYDPDILAFPNLAYPKSAVWNGPQIAVIPMWMNLLGIYYNRAMFRRLGLSEPKTWADLENVMAKLKQNGITPFAFGNLEQFHFLHMAWAAMHASTPPGRVKAWYYQKDPGVKLTDPDFVNGMTWLQGLVRRGYVNADYNAVSRNDLYNMLFSGKFGMVVLGSWALQRFSSEAPFEVGFFPIPMMDPKMKAGIVGDMGWGMGIVAYTKRRAAAERFVDFNTTGFAGRAWYQTGNIPAMKFDRAGITPNRLQDEFYAKVQAREIGQFLDTAAPGLIQVARVEGQRLMSGQITPQDWATKMQDVMNKWIEEVKRLR